MVDAGVPFDDPKDHHVCFKKLDENCSKVTNRMAMQFGSFSCELRQNNMKEGIFSTNASLLTKLIFKGDKYCKKIKEKELKQCIYIGCMQVEILQEAPNSWSVREGLHRVT